MTLEQLDSLGDKYSALIITPVEKIQGATNSVIKSFLNSNTTGVYVCFNRPHKAVKSLIEKDGINTEKIFFIDCIATGLGEAEKSDNVLHIQSPADLTGLSIAINEFIEKIPDNKFLIIDALTTLLIYNREDIVIKFVKSISEQSMKSSLKTVILTPEPRGGDLINKISLFFDKIIKV